MKKVHFVSGIVLTLFIGAHLCNHFYAVFGAHKHLAVMDVLRVVYRNVFVEMVLMLAVVAQVFSGIVLVRMANKAERTFFEKLHVFSGLYLAFFLLFHVGAVLFGRMVLSLDTNLYFGVTGLHYFPYNLFFIPYYGFAIVSFFAHFAAIHNKKMKHKVFGLTPKQQALFMLFFGIACTFIIFYALTNRLNGFEIPRQYLILVGK